MDRHQTLDGFDLDDQLARDDQIHPVPAVKPHLLVEDWQSHLPIVGNACGTKFETQALLVRGLEQPWSQSAMHLNRQSNHALTQITPMGQSYSRVAGLRALRASVVKSVNFYIKNTPLPVVCVSNSL